MGEGGKVKTRSIGSKTKYCSSFISRIITLSIVTRERLTERMIAEELGCSEATIQYWKNKHPDFRETIKNPLGQHTNNLVKRIWHIAENGAERVVTSDDGTTTTEAHTPTAAEMALPAKLGLVNLSVRQKQLEYEERRRQEQEEYELGLQREKERKARLVEERQKMRPFEEQYQAEEITLSQLLNEYYYQAVEVPKVLIDQYRNELRMAKLEGKPIIPTLNLTLYDGEFETDVYTVEGEEDEEGYNFKGVTELYNKEDHK